MHHHYYWHKHRILEFFFVMISHIVIFIAIPYFLVMALSVNFPEVMQDRAQILIQTILILGSIIVLTGALHAYFDKGNKWRCILGVVYICAIIVWIYIILGGGDTSLSYRELDIYIEFQGLLYLTLCGISLKIILAILEFFTFKDSQSHTTSDSDYR